MHTSRFACAVCAVAVAFAMSATADVEWSVEDGIGSASGSGEVVFDQAQSLAGLHVVATNGEVTLSGEGISFTNSAPTISLNGTSVFDLTLASTGSLAFAHGAGFDYRTYDESCLSTSYNTLFTGMDISKFSVVSAVGTGENMKDGTALIPFHLVHGDGTLTVQLHAIEGGWAKAIKVELVQNGDDVQGKIVYARYMSTAHYGEDFDEGASSYSIATSTTGHGYGVRSITLAQGMEPAYAKATRSIAADSLYFDTNLIFTADGDGVLAESCGSPPEFALDGELTITNVLNLAFTNKISGSGIMYLGGIGEKLTSSQAEATFTAPMPTTWTNVASGCIVSSLTNVYINAFSGLAIKSVPTWIRHFTNDGVTAVGQCQVLDGSWLKCVYLEFKQMSTNVQARIRNACYCSASNGLGVDFDTLEWGTPASGNAFRKSYTTGSATNQHVYGIGSFAMYFDEDSAYDISPLVEVSFSGANSMTCAKMCQRGGTVQILGIDALPTGASTYTVSDAGTLFLDASGCSINRGIARGKTTLYATGGSTILQNNGNVLDGANQRIYLDGSTLNLLPNRTQGSGDFPDSNNYINHLTLTDGSHVVGKYPRVGYCSACYWDVTGTSPSFVDTGIVMASTSGHVCTFNVKDVTGDDEADFIVSGPIITYDTSSHIKVDVCKAGAGTMSLLSPMRLYRPLRLDAGTILLDGSGILCGTYPAVDVQLGGGALAASAGTSNEVGVVSLTNDSQIVVGEGTVFTFPDCSAQEWTSGMKLSITGAVESASIRFGTSAKALTEDQQRALRMNGERATLNSFGYVRPGAPGTKLILR